MVVVEARVHAAELGQAHRHVAVVEDHRHPEALAQEGRDPAEVRHRDGEDDDRVDVALGLEQLRQVPLPARRHPAPDRLARRLVEDRLVGRLLGAAGSGRPSVTRARRGRRRLALDPGQVRGRPPPRRLDRRPGRASRSGRRRPRRGPSRLPPRGRAAVAVVEVDRGRDGEDLRRLHADSIGSADEGAVRSGLGGPRVRRSRLSRPSFARSRGVHDRARQRVRATSRRSGHAPRVTSFVMWANFMRFVGDGITVAEPRQPLESPKRGHFRRLEGWSVGDTCPPDPPRDEARTASGARGLARTGSSARLPAGRAAAAIWPLADEIEQRWSERFGVPALDELQAASRRCPSNSNCQEYVPIVGGANWKLADAISGERGEAESRLPLSALVSRALLAYTLEFERESPSPCRSLPTSCASSTRAACP